MQVSLNLLPIELKELILSHLSTNSLFAVAQTCHGLQEPAVEALWRVFPTRHLKRLNNQQVTELLVENGMLVRVIGQTAAQTPWLYDLALKYCPYIVRFGQYERWNERQFDVRFSTDGAKALMAGNVKIPDFLKLVESDSSERLQYACINGVFVSDLGKFEKDGLKIVKAYIGEYSEDDYKDALRIICEQHSNSLQSFTLDGDDGRPIDLSQLFNGTEYPKLRHLELINNDYMSDYDEDEDEDDFDDDFDDDNDYDDDDDDYDSDEDDEDDYNDDDEEEEEREGEGDNGRGGDGENNHNERHGDGDEDDEDDEDAWTDDLGFSDLDIGTGDSDPDSDPDFDSDISNDSSDELIYHANPNKAPFLLPTFGLTPAQLPNLVSLSLSFNEQFGPRSFMEAVFVHVWPNVQSLALGQLMLPRSCGLIHIAKQMPGLRHLVLGELCNIGAVNIDEFLDNAQFLRTFTCCSYMEVIARIGKSEDEAALRTIPLPKQHRLETFVFMTGFMSFRALQFLLNRPFLSVININATASSDKSLSRYEMMLVGTNVGVVCRSATKPGFVYVRSELGEVHEIAEALAHKPSTSQHPIQVRHEPFVPKCNWIASTGDLAHRYPIHW